MAWNTSSTVANMGGLCRSMENNSKCGRSTQEHGNTSFQASSCYYTGWQQLMQPPSHNSNTNKAYLSYPLNLLTKKLAIPLGTTLRLPLSNK
eukprot:1147507-Pelagomonas_calceolata.AAC.1